MSIKILVGASVFVLGIGCYALFGSKIVNPDVQMQIMVDLQRDMLAQLELQSVILTHIREDSLNEHE
jgi:hypothetical protein